MSHSIQQLCEQFSDLIIASRHTEGDFKSIDSTGMQNSDSLIFVAEESHLPTQTMIAPAVIMTTELLAEKITSGQQCVISVRDVRLAQALIKQHYNDYDSSDSEWPNIHPNAVVHPSAKLGAGVRIGPNAVIGKNVIIGDGTQIRANSVIEHDARLGEHCIIHSLVNIGYACTLGNGVILRPGVIIGNEGFGFAKDADHRYQRIPHTGVVEIQDDVQIGANCNVDRGTYGKTVIARGVKIDALCHIAHNCFIGDDSLFVAQSGVAGSCNIGKRVIVSGHTAIIDHITVTDDVVLVHRCGVTEDITSAGVWAGTPAKPFKEYVRGLNLQKQIDRLKKRLDQLSNK